MLEGTKRPTGGGGGGGIFFNQFWGSESCNHVHAVIRFLTLYLIRIWINPNPIGGGGGFFGPPCRFFRRASRPIGISRSNFMNFFLSSLPHILIYN